MHGGVEDSDIKCLTASGAYGRITGLPMSYMHEGKQYVCIAVSQGPGRLKTRIVALALP